MGLGSGLHSGLDSALRQADHTTVDRRALPGLFVGIVGVVIGVVGAVAGDALLGLGAGLAAFGAATSAVVLAGHLRHAEHRAESAESARLVAVAEAKSKSLLAEANSEALEAAEAVLAGGEELERGPESVFDRETGLLDERVFVVSFERKVAAARRHLRPLSLVLLDLGTELPLHPYERVRALTRFGDVLRNTLRDSDIACRLGNSVFGLILEDTAESGAVWATERLQMALSTEDRPPSQMVAGVASYPNHGLAAQDVLSRAQDALSRARVAVASGMGQVEVATEDHT